MLPLPEGHRFPMTQYARLREQVIGAGVVPAEDVLEAPAATWDELTLAHASATSEFAACRAASVPVVVVMSGGYAPDVGDIVQIHLDAVRAAAAERWPRPFLA